ncbi:hypothetical protein QCA50_012500 [Cerrena zonata]|uniref:F-box domain-containing protein n=1 Tax=Cerrena zonata TaxID=2478898 RepID=A0AAW0FU25_9APHY
MELFPPEIWHHVFTFACTDGGYTGCSLSLTSKYVNALSSGMKWYSVILKGPEQMLKFISTLEHATNHSRVRHLSISWKPDLQYPPPDFSIGLLKNTEIIDALCSYQLSIHDETFLRNKLMDGAALESEYIKRMGDQKYASRIACGQLLPLVANDLYSLSATFSFGMHVPRPFWTIPFPNLRELTIFGCAMVRFTPVSPSDEVLFPSLRYLHLIHCMNDTHVFAKCAPNLTHLRLSSVSTLSRLSESISSIVSETRQIEPDLMMLPCSLRRIILHVPIGPPKPLARQRSIGRNMIREFGTLLQSDAKDVIRILVPLSQSSLPESNIPGISPYGPTDIEKDWKERMEGGIGCWLEDGEGVLSLQHSKRRELIDVFGSRFGHT